MEGLILLIALLVCPVVMGTMMLVMWRGMRHGGGQPQPPQTSANGAVSIDDVAVDDGREAKDETAAPAPDPRPASVDRS